MFEARGEQELDDRDRRRACAGGNDLHVLLLLADDLQRVGQTGQRDDGGAVLIVVEDRDVALFLELAFDFEAAGGRNVLEVDAAEGAGEQIHRVDKLVHVMRLDAQRERIDVAERLKQHALAFHDRHARFRTNVAETQNRASVGDDGAEVVTASQLVGLVDVLLNFQTRLCDARRVCKTQVFLRCDGNRCDDFDFALPFAVQAERFFCVIHLFLLM